MIVLDASVWISALKPLDVHHQVSDQWLADWISGGGTISVPTLFLAEVGGAVARRSGVPALGLQAVADLLKDPAIRLLPVNQPRAEASARHASSLLIRGSDAVYVALAEQLGVPLITWDNEQLTRAATVIDVRAPTI